MNDQGRLTPGKGLRPGPSSRELIAAARQARADALRCWIGAIGHRLRRFIAIPFVSAKDAASGDASAGEPDARPGP